MTIGLARQRAKPRWLGLAGVVILLLGIGATAALAVHDEGVFELDGDPTQGVLTNNNSIAADHDWDQVYADHLANNHDPDTNASGAEAFSFVTDTTGAGDDILFGGATKDINDLPSWASKQTTSTSVQDKDDIEHAFAAQYITAADEVLLYFGADRFANSGDTTMGFWFYHGEVLNANDAFSGNHQARAGTCPGATCIHGDILIVSDFLNGGAAPTVQVFEWVTSGGSASTHLDLIGGSGVTPAACNGGPAPKPNATAVAPVGGGDPLCATTNQKVFSPTAWDFTPKANAGSPQTYPISTFMEGGINMTDLGFGNDCFSSFLAETRASHSVTSTLSDFALGGFGECNTTVTTTPADGAGTDLTDTDDNDVPDAQLGTGNAGVDVTDNVEVEVNGIQAWAGTVDFFICGPIDPGTCDTGGVPSGSDIAVDQDNTTATSDSANLTEVGRYCWRGEFTPDAETAGHGVDPESDASEGECFEVLPVAPDLATQAVDENGDALTGDVPFGDALYDLASLSDTADEPGDNGGDGDGNYLSINATNGQPADGTITFTLLVDDASCDTAAAGTWDPSDGDTADVSGDDDYQSGGFTTDSPGDFTWQAVYDGSTSGNTLGTDHNTDCSDDNEDVTVQQLQPTMDTEQEFVPNDSATITVDAGAGDLDGYVVFKLYVDNPTCTGDADYTSDNSLGDFDVFDSDDLGDTTLSATIGSDNTVAYDVSGTTFHWVVEFHSNTGAHLDVTSGCGNEHSSITIDNGTTQPE